MTAGLMKAQAHFEGDSIVVDAIANPDNLDHQITIQNRDNIAENVYFWVSGGKFKSPWCNVRVSRTSFDSMLVATNEWQVDLQREVVEIEAFALPNRRFKLETNQPIEIQVRHIAYGGPYAMMQGNMQFWPNASLQPGTHDFLVPLRIKGAQVVSIKVMGSCPHLTGRIFYLN